MIRRSGRSHTRRRYSRRPIILGFFSLALLLLLGQAAPALALPSGGWVRQGSGTTWDLTSVDFVDLDHGCAVGAGGTVLTTVDGGRLWSAQHSPATNWLWHVDFTDAARGWAVGQDGLMRTTDGGVTWDIQTLAADLRSVAAGDWTHAWAVGSASGGGAVFATSDGAAWTRQTTPSCGGLLDVTFVDRDHGWAVGGAGAILATSDGGASWVAQASGTTIDLRSVTFADAQHGWASGQVAQGIYRSQAVVLSTADGGQRWTQVFTGAKPSFGAMTAFVGGQRGWMTADLDGIVHAVQRSDDGGATWKLQAVAHDDLRALCAVDDTHAWAVGGSGEIIATVNGGASSDVLAPVTTISGAGDAWHDHDVRLTFSSRDESGGSGVMYAQYRLNDGIVWYRRAGMTVWADADHSRDGTNRVYVRAVDAAGNVEATKVVKVRIDTRPPVTKCGGAVSVVRGAEASIRYVVYDHTPCARIAHVTVRIYAGDEGGGERLVKSLSPGAWWQSTGVWRTASFTCTLAPGTYIYTVNAKDGAGNVGGGGWGLVKVS